MLSSERSISSQPRSSTTAAEASPNIDDPQGFDHRFADVNGIRLHYVEEGKGPLVILVHGFPFLWYLWRHQIRALATAGYRVVALDTRGYGQSDCPDAVSAYDISWLAGDIVGLMNALKENSAVLVGQGVLYSTSASCSENEKWRWAWPLGEKLSDTYTVPTKLPPFLSQQALDY
jgi:hypothetical protein